VSAGAAALGWRLKSRPLPERDRRRVREAVVQGSTVGLHAEIDLLTRALRDCRRYALRVDSPWANAIVSRVDAVLDGVP
jgi:hypothetical protein